MLREAWPYYRFRPGSDRRAQEAPVSILSPGGHGRAAIPVPIPNTEVKRPSADGTACSGRVGRRQVFYDSSTPSLTGWRFFLPLAFHFHCILSFHHEDNLRLSREHMPLADGPVRISLAREGGGA